jgi:uncharacterized damage-inducible protein DinB
MLARLRRLLSYDAWANREVLASFRAAGSPSARARNLLAHVLGTEWLWRSRIRREPKPMEIWPALTVDDCERETSKLSSAWEGDLSRATAEVLDRKVPYVNSKGEAWENSVEDILIHTILHSAYHRGQIASEMRASGFEPAYTDYIEAVRKGLVR